MISFIVPAYNEELLLAETLRAIQAAAAGAGEPCEILVVDDASTDRTAVVAETHGARVVRVNHRQIAATRNSGARAARGDVFVFVDADTLIGEDIVRGLARALREGAVGGGAAVRFDEPLPAYARILLPVLLRVFRVARLAAGCFVFCTREAFEAAGGFDARLFAGEEIALSRALGKQGRFVILRKAVHTSGRRLRAYSMGEVWSVMRRLGLGGRKSIEDRGGTQMWYGPRREDPARRAEGGKP
jgi:glycosyltransferase involved in cell wall biosynthesis